MANWVDKPYILAFIDTLNIPEHIKAKLCLCEQFGGAQFCTEWYHSVCKQCRKPFVDDALFMCPICENYFVPARSLPHPYNKQFLSVIRLQRVLDMKDQAWMGRYKEIGCGSLDSNGFFIGTTDEKAGSCLRFDV